MVEKHSPILHLKPKCLSKEACYVVDEKGNKAMFFVYWNKVIYIINHIFSLIPQEIDFRIHIHIVHKEKIT